MARKRNGGHSYKGGPLLTVDPGLEGTGIALWTIGGCATKPVRTDVFKSRAKTWMRRAAVIAAGFANQIDEYVSDQIIIEFPVLWAGSKLSQTAASRGDLFKLAYLCGAFADRIAELDDINHLYLVRPQDWKGQLSKAAVNARIKNFLGTSYPNHASDAVGMGLAAFGAWRCDLWRCAECAGSPK